MLKHLKQWDMLIYKFFVLFFTKNCVELQWKCVKRHSNFWDRLVVTHVRPHTCEIKKKGSSISQTYGRCTM